MDLRQSAKTPSGDSPTPGEVLSLFSISLDPESAAELRQFIGSVPFVRLQGELAEYPLEDELLQDSLEQIDPDICLIDFDPDRRSAVLTAEKLQERLPATTIFAVSANSQPDLIIEAMRCGCSEYVVKPISRDQLLEAVARVAGRKREKRQQQSGELLTFLGAKGGCGVTTLATHLGALLAKSCSRRTLLVDLHPGFGEAALYLGLTKHQYHFYELAESVERLDADLLQSYLLHHPSGLDLLAAPDVSEPVRHVSPEAIGHTIDFLCPRYEFVLVDCPPGLGDHNVELVRRSNQLYVVTVPEVSAVRNVIRYLDYLTRIEFPQDRVRVVLNRHVRKSAISDEEIEKAIRKSIFWKVPNQYNQVVRTINAGDPPSQLRNSEVARSLMAWAGALGNKPDAEQDKKKASRGLLGLLGR